jgi:hypothetical protein
LFTKGHQDADESCSTPHLDDLVNNKSVIACERINDSALHNPKQNVTDFLNVFEYETNPVQKDEVEGKETTAPTFHENALISGTDDILNNPLLTKLTSQVSQINLVFS